MFYTKVEELPKAKRSYHKLRILLDEFMSENIKVTKIHVNENEYAHIKYARNSLDESARNGGYPINVRLIDGEVYLIRRDI